MHAYNNNAKLPPHIRNTVSESQVITKTIPAAHLNTNDDYVLDIALLNDSLAVRQAGLTVQKHRNGHNRNQRYYNESASCERHNNRRLSFALSRYLNKNSLYLSYFISYFTLYLSYCQPVLSYLDI